MHTVEETAEEHEIHNNSIPETNKLDLKAAMDPIYDEDEDAYRDSLFGKNKEQANPNRANSTLFFKQRPSSGEYMTTSTTAERTPMTGMGATNFESQANAAKKGKPRILPS